ncbi:hypothetical protein B1H56_01460 [Christensenella minuta]|uniref:Uncharacterized protein n=1 Tax=Christensenella minuta TaxID=626937 RepID=A0A136Q643_9FIRM|nr:hypothetical protein B1H56_01460 [Christensenella minuta]KXK66155.1 hypothetical protein HMPREF3293_00891 [Christensenella minuta]
MKVAWSVKGKDALGFVQSRNIRHAKKYHSQKERAYAPRIISGVECLLFLKREVRKGVSLYVCRCDKFRRMQ